MKKIVLLLIFAVLIGNLYLAITNQWVFYKVVGGTILKGKLNPDIYELNDFPFNTINNSSGKAWNKSLRYNNRTLTPEQENLHNEYGTTALLLIKNDSLLFERYWELNDTASVTNSFSMAKSILSILIGIAIKDQLIKDINEPVGNYIDEYKLPPFNAITIKHLLTMSSGLGFNESYFSPLSWPAVAYYGSNVNATVLAPEQAHKAGSVFQYKGGDTQLLGIILKKVTGVPVSVYAQEKLWNIINAESSAYWSLDKTKGMEKVSCCFYATARDFARLGKLYLNKGNWNGIQVVDSAFVEQSLMPVNISNLNNQVVNYYGYQWWLNQINGKKVFYARGIRGQYIFVIPDEQIILVRLGHKRASKAGDELPADGNEYLEFALNYLVD